MKKNIFIPIILGLIITISSAQETEIIYPQAELTLVADGYKFTEGPAMDSNGDVYFTDQPNNKILRWNANTNEVSVFMENSGRANGLYFDNEGRLLACADEKFELWQINKDKTVTVLIKDVEGKKLNGPNDLWVDKKGGIYFTDPYYQRPYWTRTKKEIDGQKVYYLTPDKDTVLVMADDLVQPNGIIGTADGKTLFVADIGDKKTYRYTIGEKGTLIDKTLFIEMGSDGMTLDTMGNLYLTGDGVTIFNQKGEKIEHIKVPQKWTANVTFGGVNQETLFITAMNSVYTLKMSVKGIR
ncbi:SMP-30/gluconolactonase/LRE family protein [Eudoraea chungangensis]|uniref:SMP-30/gluconolactonase/LRE family protein n=1 Tax=Eudoraea chungangensis TaxID=1481905 RepID=UPI0023EBDC31|nr:SMP-30/gluconolactonase/LRE family protein [Eudoraea chungangensis]